MKKFAKMSLVAALAVAGTAASAQPLAEAIKNVDVSGTVVYRYNDINYDDGASTSDNNYKVAVSLKSKVTDDVTFNSRFIAGGEKGGFGSLKTQEDADTNLDIKLTWANFAYTGIANTTVVVGKQGLATPWTRATDSDGSEQTGTGILAMTTMGPVTAAAGYFNQTNISKKSTATSDLVADDVTYKGQNNLIVAALIGSFGPVNAQAWYLDIDESASQYFVKVDGKVGPVKMYAQYSDLDADDETAANNDINLLKAGVSAKLGMFNAGVTYARGGEDGTGILNGVAPSVSAIGYSVNAAGKHDAQAYFVDLGAQVTDKLHIGLNYDVVEADKSGTDSKELEHKEYFVQATYKHAKNLSAYVRLAQGENEFVNEKDGDYNRGRLQVEYKF